MPQGFSDVAYAKQKISIDRQLDQRSHKSRYNFLIQSIAYPRCFDGHIVEPHLTLCCVVGGQEASFQVS